MITLMRKPTELTRMLYALSGLCACLLFSCSFAFAQTQTAPQPLGLQECIDLALQNQTELIVARNNVIVSKSRLAKNTSNYLPQAAIENNAFSTGSGVLSQNTTGTALSVGLNVFDGGVREANVKAARYGVKENDARLNRTIQGTVYSVTRAYYEVLRAKRLVEVSEMDVKYSEELRDQVKYQAEVGAAASVDVLPVEAQLANARVTLLSAKNSVRTAMLVLQTTIGITPEPDFDVQEVNVVPENKTEPLDYYVEYAFKNRPDVTQAEAAIGAAKASVTAARISLYPRLVVSANYQQSITGGFRSNGSQLVGGIAFNLFDGGASRAAFKEAEASAANAQEESKQLTRDIRADVEDAYLNMVNSQERMAASEASLTAAQRNLDAQKERYAQGVAIALDLLNAQSQLITAQSNSVQAKYDYMAAIAQLEYATGKQGGA